MKFSNLSRQISNYGASGTITQEAILGLMSVLCDDIRFETGVPVDRCQVRDADQLVDELYALSYTINTLYQTHKNLIREMGESEEDQALWQQLREAEAACEAVKGRGNQQEAILEQLRSRQAELQTLIAAEAEKNAQAEQYHARVTALEQELQALCNTDLQPMKERYAALEKELAGKTELLQQIRQELEQEEEAQKHAEAVLKDAQNQLTLGRQYSDALKQDLEAVLQEQQQNDVEIDRNTERFQALQQQLEEAKAKSSAMAAECAQVQLQLDAQREDNEAFLNEKLMKAQQELNEARAQAQQMDQSLTEFTAERKNVGAKIADTGTIIELKKKDLESKNDELLALNNELDRLNGQLSAIAQDTKPLLDEIESRKNQLAGMDREKIETGLRRNLETWQAQIQELEKKQRECAELQEEITRKTSLVNSEREQLESLTARKREQDDAYSALCQDVETLNTQLEALKDPEYVQRIEKLQHQQGILQQLRTNLEQGNRAIGCGWSFDLRQDLDQRLTASAQALKDLQKAISDYTALWQSNLNA